MLWLLSDLARFIQQRRFNIFSLARILRRFARFFNSRKGQNLFKTKNTKSTNASSKKRGF